MKIIKGLMLLLLTTVGFTAANAQVHHHRRVIHHHHPVHHRHPVDHHHH